MDLEGTRKPTECNMEGQAILHLKALMRKTASIFFFTQKNVPIMFRQC
jgi:hypothetical protein